MNDGEKFGDRLRTIYENERSYAVGRAEGEPVDQREVKAKAAVRAFNEVLNDGQVMELVQRSLDGIAAKSDKLFLPHFDESGHAKLRLDGIVRVADNLLVGVVYATQDDWLAYLEIKRRNFQRQDRNWQDTRSGIHAIVGDLRAYTTRSGIVQPRTLDACPYLFDQKGEQAA